jgi:hypothetical protein
MNLNNHPNANVTRQMEPQYVSARVFIGHYPSDKIDGVTLAKVFSKYGEVLGRWTGTGTRTLQARR